MSLKGEIWFEFYEMNEETTQKLPPVKYSPIPLLVHTQYCPHSLASSLNMIFYSVRSTKHSLSLHLRIFFIHFIKFKSNF